MTELETLLLYRRLEVLAQCHDKGHIYIEGSDASNTHTSYAELLERARRIQAHLVQQGFKPGDRLALVATDARNFIPAFLGGVLAGVTLVPLAPPPVGGQSEAYRAQVSQVVRVADISVIMAPLALRSLMQGTSEAISVLAYEDLSADIPLLPSTAPLSPESICFLQFTSGSTGDPKGVIVTYRNLAANCRAIMEHGVRITDTDVGVSWLPLYHDMGLIGKVLAPLTYPTNMVYLSTSAFIRNPNLWLDTITRYQGTITFAPNFAFALVVKHFRRRPKAINLDSLRVLGCGAEPVNPDVLHEFTSTFQDHGLRREAIMPSYGMAEATLAVSFRSPWKELVIDQQAYEIERKARVIAAAATGVRLVSCGRAFPEHEIAIIDENGKCLPSGQVGEIVVGGPSISSGYFRNSAATLAAYVDGRLRTGDLGLLLDDELYVCGRIKDLIIVNGHNHYPQDIEWPIERLPGVRTGAVVVCAVPGHETERVVVLAEVRKHQVTEDLDAQIRRLVSEVSGIVVHDVVLLAPGSIPKTTSGKVQRAKTRAYYLGGYFHKTTVESEQAELTA